ncbi:hypothetical protein EX30DRAFT_354353 [Ascodesmis nigricans]|uniref:DUF4484 domain-containing protein n=1 Tax=Ascodesmis nigricans TaxID=341454 RepID=A0A4S2N2A3_9PEZI|nr:hypothetical protein EX30DRAFT_354353 [Ascodesmis nigricans]
MPDREELPPLAALFVIFFDVKAGYTIGWQRTVGNIDLEGVEFSSLPSGLHNLKEDLVYFVHGQYAGVSAFVNVPAGDEERGALMLSVGALVPLPHGRLGRSWRHTEGLKSLAREFATDITDFTSLEAYFTTHSVSPSSPHPSSRHRRSLSIASLSGHLPPTLSAHHPALSLPSFTSLFGPLIFPLHRFALARKRILVVTHAPVEPACNYVYDISILSNIPQSEIPLLPKEPERLKPLFSVGVHDIPMLEKEGREGRGWVACTTDEILVMKTTLFDVLVRLPPPHAEKAEKRSQWVRVQVKATQRDLRRYRILQRGLRLRYRRRRSLFPDSDEGEVDTPAVGPPSTSSPFSASKNTPQRTQEGRAGVDDDVDGNVEDDEDEDDDDEPPNIEETCEHLTWREIAYTSFIWWASAGENTRSGSGACSLDEQDMDQLVPYPPLPQNPLSPQPPQRSQSRSPSPAHSTSSEHESNDIEVRHRRPPPRPIIHRDPTQGMTMHALPGPELDLIAYFHQFTSRIIKTLANAVEAADNGDDNHDDTEDDNYDLALAYGSGDEGEVADGYGDERRGLLGAQAGVSVEEDRRGESVYVSVEEMEEMGLDRYSKADASVVGEIVGKWWGREVEVQRWRFTCCGVECG